MAMLEGRLALVTGASRGIGAATAKALAAEGAHVVLTARTASGLEEVEEAIHAAGGNATIAPLDLTDAESVGRLAEAIRTRWNALDILVLNAAMLGQLAPVASIDPKELVKIVALNLTAQAVMISAFDALLRNGTNPRVIGLTTSVAQSPRAYWGAYGASKAGFETLLSAYALENRNIGRVRVAIFDPGATRTAMRARAFPGEDPATLKGPEEVAARIAGLASEDFATGYRERLEA